MIGPDDTTFEYLAGRADAPAGRAWDHALSRWQSLSTGEGAAFDAGVVMDASELSPMITFGTNPGMGIPVRAPVPSPDRETEPSTYHVSHQAPHESTTPNTTPSQPSTFFMSLPFLFQTAFLVFHTRRLIAQGNS